MFKLNYCYQIEFPSIDQARNIGESPHGQDRDLPDVTSSEGIYLPGEDYHEYEEIDEHGRFINISFMVKPITLIYYNVLI